MEYYLGIDFGGTTISMGMVSKNGAILEERILNTLPERGSKHAFERVATSVSEMKMALSGNQELAAAGVGIPGIYDNQDDRMMEASNLPGWKDVRIARELNAALNMNVYVENDANLAALGEGWKGAGKDEDVLFMITLGSGVGGAIVHQNNLFSFNNISGEFGHMIVDADGDLCKCGRKGCIETFISKYGMVSKAEQLREQFLDSALNNYNAASLSPHVIALAAESGDKAAGDVFAYAAHGLAIGIANISNVLGINVFVLGGGITNAFHLLEPELNRHLQHLIFDYKKRNIQVKKASLGEKAGLIGAAKFAMDSHFRDNKR